MFVRKTGKVKKKLITLKLRFYLPCSFSRQFLVMNNFTLLPLLHQKWSWGLLLCIHFRTSALFSVVARETVGNSFSSILWIVEKSKSVPAKEIHLATCHPSMVPLSLLHFQQDWFTFTNYWKKSEMFALLSDVLWTIVIEFISWIFILLPVCEKDVAPCF